MQKLPFKNKMPFLTCAHEEPIPVSLQQKRYIKPYDMIFLCVGTSLPHQYHKW